MWACVSVTSSSHLKCNFISLCEISTQDNKIHSAKIQLFSQSSRDRSLFVFASPFPFLSPFPLHFIWALAHWQRMCTRLIFSYSSGPKRVNFRIQLDIVLWLLFLFCQMHANQKCFVYFCFTVKPENVCVYVCLCSCNISRFDHTSIEIHCVNIFLMSYFECDACIAAVYSHTHTIWITSFGRVLCHIFWRRALSPPLSLTHPIFPAFRLSQPYFYLCRSASNSFRFSYR